MTTDNLQIIREAASGAGESVFVLIVPAARMPELFGASTQAQSRFEADLSVAEYREQVEPKLSDGRIREMCAEGVFPDTTTQDGEIVPGVYKDSKGEWRITREGIVARQRAERAEGLRKRVETAEQKYAKAEVAASKYGAKRSKGGSVKKRSGCTGSSSAAPAAVRPNRGSWERHVMEEAGS